MAVDTIEENVGRLLAVAESTQRDIRDLRDQMRHDAELASASRDKLHDRMDLLVKAQSDQAMRQTVSENDISAIKSEIEEIRIVTNQVTTWKIAGMGALGVTGFAASGITAFIAAYWSHIVAFFRGHP